MYSNQRFEQNDIKSLKRKRGYHIVFSPVNSRSLASIVCLCKKMATQQTDWAQILKTYKALMTVGKLKMRNKGENSRQ